MVNFKEIYHFSRFQRGSNIFQGGSNFFQGVQLLIPYRNPYYLWFSGGGGGGGVWLQVWFLLAWLAKISISETIIKIVPAVVCING